MRLVFVCVYIYILLLIFKILLQNTFNSKVIYIFSFQVNNHNYYELEITHFLVFSIKSSFSN